MKFKIYDYDNKSVEVEIPDKPIHYIMVTILGGDETGTVYFEDGTSQTFNSSEYRIIDIFDGCYVVMRDEVNKWISINPHVGQYETKSYKRYETWKKIKATQAD